MEVDEKFRELCHSHNILPAYSNITTKQSLLLHCMTAVRSYYPIVGIAKRSRNHKDSFFGHVPSSIS
jgi:hypothetical protein